MKTSYKFWYITRYDDGFIFEAAIVFFEGDIITADERDFNGDIKKVTRYRRTKLLKPNDLKHTTQRYKKDLKGNDCVLYTQKEFGKIKTDDELRVFLNTELAKDPIREAEDAQTETDLEKIKLLNIK